MIRVLLVDDDVELCEMLAQYLAPEGFEVVAVHDGETGVARAVAGGFDAVVLDVMLPRMNGTEVLRRIRAQVEVPVLMLTARGDEVDRIIGLELGADDYMPKPGNPRELVARLRAILRRGETRGAPVSAAAGEIRVGDAVVRPAERVAEWRGQRLDLTSTEFTLLEFLLANAGRVVSKGELSQRVLGRPLARYDRSIDMHVSNLRHKLSALDDGRSPIQTVRGTGYQFVKR
ncbi:MAG: response regulator transcription factor [Alphaproteobacteria bacterium]